MKKLLLTISTCIAFYACSDSNGTAVEADLFDKLKGTWDCSETTFSNEFPSDCADITIDDYNISIFDRDLIIDSISNRVDTVKIYAQGNCFNFHNINLNMANMNHNVKGRDYFFDLKKLD